MYIDTLGTTTYSTESSQATSDNELGKDAFLTMLVAQMENQDPLNPMEGTEFTAQLAQYSSLEQLYNVNDNLISINEGQTDASNYSALDFMGKEIYVDGNELTLEQGGTASGGFTIESAANCTVNILDANEQLVRSLLLEDLDAGTHGFDWDGLAANGEAVADGTYTFKVKAVGEDGKTLSVDTYSSGTVDRVSLEDDTPMLYVGDKSIAVSDVIEIRNSTES